MKQCNFARRRRNDLHLQGNKNIAKKEFFETECQDKNTLNELLFAVLKVLKIRKTHWISELRVTIYTSMCDWNLKQIWILRFWEAVIRKCSSKQVFFKIAPATFFKISFQHRCFPVKFAKFLRTPVLQNTSGGCSLLFSLTFSHFWLTTNVPCYKHLWANERIR